MNAIRSVFAAFTNLAASINALASVVDVATGRLRQSLALEEAPPVIGHGDIIDGHAEADSSTNGTAKGRGKRQAV